MFFVSLRGNLELSSLQHRTPSTGRSAAKNAALSSGQGGGQLTAVGDDMSPSTRPGANGAHC